MINNHVSEYSEKSEECVECHGKGYLTFEDLDECQDYCDATFNRDDANEAIQEWSSNEELSCRECGGTGYVTVRR